MTREYYQIKDKCRGGLLKYLAEAVSLLPNINNTKILDIGCGSGVPTLWIAENYGGTITAIDTDGASLEWLRVKTIADIILAEGFLNIIGFELGFVKVIDMVKGGGYFVIHDEYKDHDLKCDFISKNHCEIVGTVFLNESVWWNDYYRQIEAEIESLDAKQIIDLFKAESKELELYRKDPSPFRSIYYVVKK